MDQEVPRSSRGGGTIFHRKARFDVEHADPQMVVPDEAAVLERLAERWTSLSEHIKRTYFIFGEDSTGDPAVWVRVVVSPDLNPSPLKITDLNRATTAIKRDILETGPVWWPYVQIETE